MDSNPVKAVPLFNENNAWTRCLTDAEEVRLYKALPDYLKPFLMVALNTSMRWREMARLTWSDADFYTWHPARPGEQVRGKPAHSHEPNRT